MANAKSLEGKRVAILVEDGVEQIELTEPRSALEEAGAETHLISPRPGRVRAWNHDDWGGEFEVDASIDDVDPAEFDAVFVPGGVMSPDRLRMNHKAVEFLRAADAAGKPIAAICHGPWLLAEADIVRGRRVTSYPSLRTDLRNAGAEWIDDAVVTDQGMVTSRGPRDLPAFIAKTIEEIAEGEHRARKAA